MQNITKRAVVAFVGVLAAFAAGVTTASAAPTDGLVVETTAGMTIKGFDRAVAEANGYEIRTDAAGREYSVKRGTPPEVGVNSPGGSVVEGNCGISRVKINYTGRGSARLETGASVYAPIVAYEWHVKILDPWGVSSQDWGPLPGPGTPTLGLGRDLSGLGGGNTFAEVQGNTSRVILQGGAICWSGTHADSTYVYP
jgi:hypothetical protein